MIKKRLKSLHCCASGTDALIVGKNAVLYDNTAHSNGVYVKCKECRKEFEIRI